MTKPLVLRVPIFPLAGAILFPRSQLPLHIFEDRYREMVRDALDGAGTIGMIQPRVASGPGREGIGFWEAGPGTARGRRNLQGRAHRIRGAKMPDCGSGGNCSCGLTRRRGELRSLPLA